MKLDYKNDNNWNIGHFCNLRSQALARRIYGPFIPACHLVLEKLSPCHIDITLDCTTLNIYLQTPLGSQDTYFFWVTSTSTGSALCAKSRYYLLCSRVGEQQQSFLPRA